MGNIVLLLLCLLTSQTDCQISLTLGQTCDKIGSSLCPLVVGGCKTTAEDAPWHTVLELKNKAKSDIIVNHCGGNILSPTIILTAAHCVWQNGPKCPEHVRKQELAEECHKLPGGCPPECTRVRPEDLNVYAGVESIRQTDRIPLKVKRIILHPGWNKTYSIVDSVKSGHDLAIIVLKTTLKFNSKVRQICLPNDQLRLLPHEYVTLNGFGFTGFKKKSFEGIVAEGLQQGRLQIKHKDECTADHGKEQILGDQLCAYSADTSSCHGDSGSGLVKLVNAAPVLVGTVSFGNLFCRKPTGVYTNVQSHVDWIQDKTNLRDFANSAVVVRREWTNWSSCSRICGGGIQKRQRPICRGKNCRGSFTEKRKCNTKPCGKECVTISGPSAGFPCVFPFTYQGVKHSSCIMETSPDGEHFWCATKVDSQGIYKEGHWGRCQGDCEQTHSNTINPITNRGRGKECVTMSGPSAGFPCVFPFIYQGVKHSSCIMETSPDGEHFWCATKVDAQENYKEGHWGRCQGDCEQTHPNTVKLRTNSGRSKECVTMSGPSAGFPCVFPFTYQGNKYSSCIMETSPDGEHLWCPTKLDAQGNYKEGHWGRCQGVCEQTHPRANNLRTINGRDGNENDPTIPKKDFIEFANALDNARICDRQKDNSEWMERNAAGCNKSSNVVANFNDNNLGERWCLRFGEDKPDRLEEFSDRCGGKLPKGLDMIYCRAIQNQLSASKYLKCDTLQAFPR